MSFNKAMLIAYMLVAFVAAFSLYQAYQAIELARQVDYAGDIRACENENFIRSEANKKNAVLEQTAALIVNALGVISVSSDNQNKLEEIANEADKLRVDFPPAKMTDCQKVFPKP